MIPVCLLCDDPHLAAPLREGLLMAGHAPTDNPVGALCVVAGSPGFRKKQAQSAEPVFILDSTAGPLRLGVVLMDIRRMATALSSQPSLDIGPFHFIPAQNLLRRREDGQDMILTEKETRILSFLAARGDAVGREELLHHIWGYAENVDTHTVETHIYRLRQKIETDPAAPALLTTTDSGYLLKI